MIFDALRLKDCDEGTVQKEAVSLTLVDGLVSFADAITKVFPRAHVHTASYTSCGRAWPPLAGGTGG